MNPVTRILGALWRVWFFFNFALVFFILYPFFYFLVMRESLMPAAFRLKKVWARIILFTTGIRCSVQWEEKPDPQKAYIFCPNHTSYLDIVVSGLIIPNYFHFMAKAELTKIPFFRIFFRKMDIPVDRGSSVSSHKAYLRAAQDLDKGISILMYPEGTIPNHTPKLKKFKSGPFKLAIEKQVPLVPVTFLTNWKLLPDGRRMNRGGYPGVSRVVVHKAIETKGMTEADEEKLMQQVYTLITTTLQNYADQRRNSD